MEDHYKLYEGYCKKTNECRKLLNEFDYSEIEGNQVYSPLRRSRSTTPSHCSATRTTTSTSGTSAVTAASPAAASPSWSRTSSSGVDELEGAVRKAASAARGWVMVGYDLNDGSLFNYIMDTQNLWAVYNMVPVLAIDVYEHAYVRDFGATPDGRKQYVEAFFRNIDWDHVNRQLAQAEAAKQGADASGAREPQPAGRS